MGCGGSKKKQRINLKMETCGISDIDNLFTAAADPIQNLEDVSRSLNKTIKKFKRATGANILKDSTFNDAITAMLYAYSASTNGNFSEIEFRIMDHSPYVGVNKHSIKHEQKEISEAWDDIATALIETPPKMVELPGQIESFINESKNFSENVKSLIENLDMMDKLKASKCVANNLGRLTDVTKVLNETKTAFSGILEACTNLSKRFNDAELEKIHKVGKEAHKENVFEPKSIVAKYWHEPTKVDIKLDKPKKHKAGEAQGATHGVKQDAGGHH